MSGFRQRLFRLLRVPAEPEPPAGAPGSLRRFRAAPNFLKYSLLTWAGKQAGAAWGLITGLYFVTTFDDLPWVAHAVEVVGVLAFVAQFFLSLGMVFLDYQLRWYLVTDRSLRIREGAVKVTEKTQSFANLQHVSIRRGPVQRLLGIADLEVRTAGGGEGKGDDDKKDNLHTAYFRGVDNAEEIRDVILARLRSFRDSGLGDPDEASRTAAGEETGEAAGVAGGAVGAEALQEALAELVAVAGRLEGAAGERTG